MGNIIWIRGLLRHILVRLPVGSIELKRNKVQFSSLVTKNNCIISIRLWTIKTKYSSRESLLLLKLGFVTNLLFTSTSSLPWLHVLTYLSKVFSMTSMLNFIFSV